MHVLPSYNGDGYVREKRPMVAVSPTSFTLAKLRKYLGGRLRGRWLASSTHSRRRSTLNALTSPPISPEALIPTASTARFILLCMLWYTTSALSSNTGKAILTQFRYPITLTFVQFGFVAGYCLIMMSPPIHFSRLRSPSVTIFNNTLPMGMFQVGGHIFSSMAISRIPVSTVHTIKALSPLFTVVAYALLFRVSYSAKTYISLFPLTIGVMLACSFDMSASNSIGLLCAFGSALVFVSQNIFFKKIMPSSSSHTSRTFSHPSHKLDKINLLFYSSCMAFILMIPIWIFSDLPIFLSASPVSLHPTKGHTTSAHPHSIPTYFFLNGTVHFAQSILAFILLSSTSPVTYSIASLIKRVAVICIAIVWFKQHTHPVQALGIALTFVGLWMYNSAKGDGSVERGEKKRGRVERAAEGVLPSTMEDTRADMTVPLHANDSVSPVAETTGTVSTTAYSRPRAQTSTSSPMHAPHTHTPAYYPPRRLHIDITPAKLELYNLPRQSYPSPPPSLDSPIETAVPLGLAPVLVQA